MKMKINSQDNSEIQLFVIWSKGRYAETDILADIAAKFEIIQTFSITWTPYMVHQNFMRFYDTKLPRNSQKEIYAGADEFKLIVVRDNEPTYDYRRTSKGRFIVNTKMFDAKAKYRELTNGGHKIHGTNDTLELKHDLVMLLGLSLHDFLKKYDKQYEENIDIALVQDLPGAIGWKSFDELFYVLNECDEYVVLRNSNNISLEYYQKNKGDIDLLVKNRNRCQYILGDLSCIDSETNEQSKVSVDNKVILFELYNAGENLFEDKFENYLFKNKVLRKSVFCLPKKLEFYALLYHALIFHRNLSDKHILRIEASIKELGELQEFDVTQNKLFGLLVAFFTENDFTFIAPNDNSVYFNFELLKSNGIPISKSSRAIGLRRVLNKIIVLNSFKSYYKITVFPFLINEIDIVMAFRFRFFVKEVRFSLGGGKYKL